MSLARAWAVVRQDLGVVLAVSCALVPIGVVTLPCLIGVPILAYALAKLTAALLGAAHRARGEARGAQPSLPWTGAYALTGLATVAGAMATGAWVAVHALDGQSEGVRYGAAFGVALIASIVVGAALAPFAFAPFAVSDGTTGIVRPLTRSFELAARLGPRRMMRLGATAGRWVGASILLMAGIFVVTTPDAALSSALLAAPFGIIPGPPLAGALLADAYVEAKAMPERAASRSPASVRLRALSLVLAPSVLLLCGALAVGAATPTSMREVRMSEPIRRGLHGPGVGAGPQRRELGRARVTTSAHGVVIEASDGGGAGSVDARFDTTQSALYLAPGEQYGGGAGTTAVVVTSGERWALTIVDDDGVRQDDALTHRVLGRLGRLGSAALGLGMLLLLVLAWRIGVDLGEARAIDVPDLREAGGGVLSALEGTLRLGEGARARAGRGVFQVDGDAWLEADGGALRFKIPEGSTPALGASGTPRDGSALVLLSRFSRISPAGLRTASTPWPGDARLVVGDRADAEHALVERATRVASWIVLPAVVVLGTAAIVLVTSL